MLSRSHPGLVKQLFAPEVPEIKDGIVVTGRILSNTDTDVTLAVAEKKETKEVTIALSDIKRAQVEIEFNRKDGDK